MKDNNNKEMNVWTNIMIDIEFILLVFSRYSMEFHVITDLSFTLMPPVNRYYNMVGYTTCNKTLSICDNGL